MNKLISFSPAPLALQMAGDFQLRGRELQIQFALIDPNSLVLGGMVEGSWPASKLQRQHDLWRQTCFEAFWGVPGSTHYYELNLSGAGAWNLYEFTNYRLPFPPQESASFALLEQQCTKSTLSCRLQAAADWPSWEANLCAVVKTQNDTLYFSTKHGAEKPDFHQRSGFSLKRGPL